MRWTHVDTVFVLGGIALFALVMAGAFYWDSVMKAQRYTACITAAGLNACDCYQIVYR